MSVKLHWQVGGGELVVAGKRGTVRGGWWAVGDGDGWWGITNGFTIVTAHYPPPTPTYLKDSVSQLIPNYQHIH